MGKITMFNLVSVDGYFAGAKVFGSGVVELSYRRGSKESEHERAA